MIIVITNNVKTGVKMEAGWRVNPVGLDERERPLICFANLNSDGTAVAVDRDLTPSALRCGIDSIRVISLRRLSRMLCGLVAILAACSPVQSAPASAVPPEYRLRLYHTHTNERINIVYRKGDA
jgi:hypothetical protein